MDAFSEICGINEDHLIVSQGEEALKEGLIDSALSYFIKVVKESEDPELLALCHCKLAECYYRKERWRDCIESARVSYQHIESQAFLALSCYKRGDSHMAMVILEKISDFSLLPSHIKELIDNCQSEIRRDTEGKVPNIPKYINEMVKDFKVQGNYKFKSNDFGSAFKLYSSALNILDNWLIMVEGSKHFSDLRFLEQYQKLYGILISNIINCHMKTDRLNECQELCQKLIKVQPDWKKSQYWLGMYHLSCYEFSAANEAFQSCLSCPHSEKDKIEERMNFVTFCQNKRHKFESKPLSYCQKIHDAYSKNCTWLAGNFFALSISKIYNDTSLHWHMTTSALIDNSGEITNFMAPKYEASEKDRNLINEMKRNQKKKFYIHVTQTKSDGSQRIDFTDIEQLSPICQDTLFMIEEDLNSKIVFNAFIKNYIS